MEQDDLLSRAESVRSASDFAAFLGALQGSFYIEGEYGEVPPEAEELVDRTGQEWTHVQIDSFLEAWASWMTDSESPQLEPLTWSSLARMLCCAAAWE
jgi:hypothetical protein